MQQILPKLDSGEKIIAAYKPSMAKHYWSLFVKLLFIQLAFMFASLAVTLLANAFGGNVLLYISLLLLVDLVVVVAAFVTVSVLSYRKKAYFVTNKRAIKGKGVFRQRFEDMPLASLYGMAVGVSLFDKIIGKGTGTLKLMEKDAQKPRLTFSDVAAPQSVAKVLKDAAEGKLTDEKSPESHKNEAL